MHCYICDDSEFNGADIIIDFKTNKPICRICLDVVYDALEEFDEIEDKDEDERGLD